MSLRFISSCLFSCFLFFCFSLFPEDVIQKQKKHILSISATFKNEAPFLKEWIEYHRLVGVDHFYLYNLKSKDRYYNVLRPYIRDGIVTLIQWHDLPEQSIEDSITWALSVKIPAHEHAVKYKALNETKWLIFLEIDEFLVPVKTDNLVDLLESYNNSSGFVLKSDCFDASTNDFAKRRLLIEAGGLVKEPSESNFKSIEKSIIKPEDYQSFSWPPLKCKFKEKKNAVHLGRNEIRINRYTNRSPEAALFVNRKDKLHIDNRIYSENEMKGILDLGYEVEDSERVIQRFVPDLLKNMGYSPAWSW